MHDLPPGVVRVNARKLGFQPVERRLSMAEGRTVLPVVMRQRVATTLDTVTVVVDSATPLPRHEEFETRRRNHEATVSITREDIRRRNPAQAWQMLTTVPSIKIVDNDTMVIVRSTRTSIASLLSNDHCWTLIAIDGVVLNRTAGQKGFDLRQLPHPDEIYGMEVFAGAASIPLRYGGEGDGKWCGLIAIWTR
jgi:outer membrane cobalamin receptor